jgi:hypothetical protein
VVRQLCGVHAQPYRRSRRDARLTGRVTGRMAWPPRGGPGGPRHTLLPPPPPQPHQRGRDLLPGCRCVLAWFGVMRLLQACAVACGAEGRRTNGPSASCRERVPPPPATQPAVPPGHCPRPVPHNSRVRHFSTIQADVGALCAAPCARRVLHPRPAHAHGAPRAREYVLELRG